jgi:hypothetical protein
MILEKSEKVRKNPQKNSANSNQLVGKKEKEGEGRRRKKEKEEEDRRGRRRYQFLVQNQINEEVCPMLFHKLGPYIFHSRQTPKVNNWLMLKIIKCLQEQSKLNL